MRNNDALNEQFSRAEVRTYIKDVANHKILPSVETRELIKEAQAGSKEAMQRIIKHNMKLVIKIAENYVGRGVGLEDLCQEGALGIVPAVKAFKLKKKIQFSTYATWWIRKLIGLALTKQAGSYKIPFSYTVLANKAITVRGELEVLLGREVTIEEMAAVLEVSPSKLTNAIKAVQGGISIHSPLYEDMDESNEITLGETLESCIDVGKGVEDRDMANLLDSVLENYLNKEELYAIKYMNGYYEQKPKLERLSALLSVTEERARQIFERGMKKLKDPDIRQLVGDVL